MNHCQAISISLAAAQRCQIVNWKAATELIEITWQHFIRSLRFFRSCSSEYVSIFTDIFGFLFFTYFIPWNIFKKQKPSAQAAKASGAQSCNIRNYVSTFSRLFIVFFVFKKPSPFTFKRYEGKVQKSRSKSTKRHKKDKFKKTK